MGKMWHVVMLSLGSFPIMASFWGDWQKSRALKKAERLEKSGNYDRAAELYVKIGDHHRAAELYEHREKYSSAAQIYEDAGEYEHAVRMYEKAHEYYSVGKCYEKVGKYKEAAQAYYNGRSHSNAARIFEQIGDYGNACSSYYEDKNFLKAVNTGSQISSNPEDETISIRILFCLAESINALQLKKQFYQDPPIFDYELIARLFEKYVQFEITKWHNDVKIPNHSAEYLIFVATTLVLTMEKSGQLFQFIKNYEAAAKILELAIQFCQRLSVYLKREKTKANKNLNTSSSSSSKEASEKYKQLCEKEQKRIEDKISRFTQEVQELLIKDQEIHHIFQQQHNIMMQPDNEQLNAYIEMLKQCPQNISVRFSLIKLYIKLSEWEAAFEQIQDLLNLVSHINEAKTLLLRAQCYFGRADGADVMLGLQDVRTALEQNCETLSPDELLAIAYQLSDAQYLQATGTRVRFPQEYQQVIDLVSTEVERKYTHLFEERRYSQIELFERSDEIKNTFPRLARVILANMADIYQKRLQKIESFDPQEVFDVILALREREFHDLVTALFNSMITTYERLFKADKPIKSAQLFSLAKKFQEYGYAQFAEQLMQAMIVGYQHAFDTGASIDFALMLSMLEELRDLELPQVAATLVGHLIRACNARLLGKTPAGNERKLLGFALQLWQNGYRIAAQDLIKGIGASYRQQIGNQVNMAQTVMDIADEFWKRAQEQPEMQIFDLIAENLWQSVVAALEKALPLDKLTKTNVEPYYLLFKAYQATREPIKCGGVGLKILGVMGFQGYKDVRQIVDNLVTSGFQAQQWQATGDDSRVSSADFVIQPAVSSGKAEQFGKYTGTYFIKGGMGEIYKGTAPDGSLVAIKRLLRYAGNDGWSRRFMREMQIVLRLAHPHIVTVLDVNKQEGYYVMEWADGGTLDDLLKARKTLPPADALRIAADIADALDAAHQQGIIHRDIKPSNILLFSNHGAKLTDFGIAHIETDTRLTDSGQHPGTPRYMSPEQCMGAKITLKTDMFSLGLVLHEALTGDIPNRAEFVRQKDSEEIIAATAFPFPEEIRNIVVKCLRTNDNRRCSASELRADLQRMAVMTQD